MFLLAWRRIKSDCPGLLYTLHKLIYSAHKRARCETSGGFATTIPPQQSEIRQGSRTGGEQKYNSRKIATLCQMSRKLLARNLKPIQSLGMEGFDNKCIEVKVQNGQKMIVQGCVNAASGCKCAIHATFHNYNCYWG